MPELKSVRAAPLKLRTVVRINHKLLPSAITGGPLQGEIISMSFKEDRDTWWYVVDGLPVLGTCVVDWMYVLPVDADIF